MKTWNQADAIALCVKIEKIAPRFGAHIALSGGCLYKQGKRKDLDLIFYRIRQSPEIAFIELFKELETIGIVKVSGFGFCHKCIFYGRAIDFLCPEEESGQYEHLDDPADKLTTDDLLR